MPSVSAKQERAMRAAAAGKSTLGIPQEVGEEYVKADKRKRELANRQRRKASRK